MTVSSCGSFCSSPCCALIKQYYLDLYCCTRHRRLLPTLMFMSLLRFLCVAPWSCWTGTTRCGTWPRASQFAQIHTSRHLRTHPVRLPPTRPQTSPSSLSQTASLIPPHSLPPTCPQTPRPTPPHRCPLTHPLCPHQTLHPVLHLICLLKLHSAIPKRPPRTSWNRHPTPPIPPLWARRWSPSLAPLCRTAWLPAPRRHRPTLSLWSSQTMLISSSQMWFKQLFQIYFYVI